MDSSQWSSTSNRPDANKSGWLANCAAALFGLIVFVATLRLGTFSAGADLDPSWSAVLGWAAHSGVRWGHSLIYTYGPLGYVHQYASYDPQSFDLYLLAQVLMGLGYAFLYAICFRALAPLERLLFALTVAVYLPWLYADALMLSAMVFAPVALDYFVRTSPHSRLGYLGLIVVAFFINAIGLLKFSAFPTSVLLCGVGIVLLLRQRRPAAAAGLAALWIASALVLWLGHGQRLDDLPAFFTGSLQVAAGYGAAMGTDGSDRMLYLGLATLSGVALALLLWLYRESAKNLRSLALAGYLAFTLYVLWRASFTRADDGHIIFFFPVVAFILFALLALGTARLGTGLRLGIGAAALGGLFAVTCFVLPRASWQNYTNLVRSVPHTLSLLDGRDLRAYYDQNRAKVRAELDLPQIRRIIGNERVDLFGQAQGALLINDFNYAPRPIFQSYSAYTSQLLRINEAYYLGAEAPPFVLLHLAPIDQHYPTSEDAYALLALLRNYKPAALEKGFLLMRRDPAAKPQRQADFDGPFTTVSAGEWLELDAGDESRMIYLRYELSLLGKLRALALREPPMMMEVQSADGTTERFRLVRSSSREGFPISPFLANQDFYLRWYAGLARFPIARVRLVTEGREAFFKPVMQIGFAPVAIPDSGGQPLPAEVADSMYPGFSLAPQRRNGMINSVFEGKDSVLFTHAPATLEFEPEPGNYALRMGYGVRSAVLGSPACIEAKADGIALQLEQLRGGSVQSLFARDINPFQVPEHRGVQQVTLDNLAIQAGDVLRLTVTPGPSGSNACDWGYVSEFDLQPR